MKRRAVKTSKMSKVEICTKSSAYLLQKHLSVTFVTNNLIDEDLYLY